MLIRCQKSKLESSKHCFPVTASKILDPCYTPVTRTVMSLENKLIIVVQTTDNKFCNIAFTVISLQVRSDLELLSHHHGTQWKLQ